MTEHMIFFLAGDWDEALATDPAAQSEAGRLIARILSHHLERPLAALELVDRSIESAPALKENA